MSINKSNKIQLFEYQSVETKSSIRSSSNAKHLNNLKTNSNNRQNFFESKAPISRKLYNSNSNNNFIENKCGRNCENLKTLSEMEMTIKEILDVNEKLKKINEYLVNSIKNKEDMYLAITKELYQTKSYLSEIKNKERSLLKNASYASSLTQINEKVKIRKESKYSHDMGVNIVNNRNQHRFSKESGSNGYNTNKIPRIKISLLKPTETNHPIEKENNNIKHKTVIGTSELLPQAYRPNSNLMSFINSSDLNEILTNKMNSHYQKISDLGRNLSRKYKNQSGRSLLSMNDDEFKKLINLHLQKEIYELTFSDEDFVHAMRNIAEEKLISYCDVIGSMIKDYQHGIKLIQRIKHFLSISVNFVKSVLKQDTTTCLIRNTCEILNCERTSLFVLDKNSSMLVLDTGDKVKKSEIKVPKDKGLVGACFISGQKVKVDDAYSDERFIKEVDKMTGYKTKTVLCLPLKDNEGNIFGVIQSVNKKGGLFDNDDEELMEIFSAQASVILKSSLSFDLNASHTYKLKIIVQFSLEVYNIKSVSQFTFLCESFIMTAFNNTMCKFIFYDSKSDQLYNVNKYDTVTELPKAGILFHVLKNKELYGCNSTQDFYYNNLADIESGHSIITFPIIDSNHDNKVLAIVQFAYNGTLLGERKNINEYDFEVIEFFKQIALSWILKRKKISLNI